MAGTTTGNDFYELFGTTTTVTGAAPTDATDGQALKDLTGITVVVKTGGGNLAGTGTLSGYVYDTRVAAWARAKNLDLTVDATGIAAQAFEPFEVLAPRNSRVKWVPTGVGFTGGGSGGVYVYQLGYNADFRGLS